MGSNNYRGAQGQDKLRYPDIKQFVYPARYVIKHYNMCVKHRILMLSLSHDILY